MRMPGFRAAGARKVLGQDQLAPGGAGVPPAQGAALSSGNYRLPPHRARAAGPAHSLTHSSTTYRAAISFSTWAEDRTSIGFPGLAIRGQTQL